MIKCVIFDFGRVIGDFDHMITCNKLVAFSLGLTAEEIYDKIFNHGLEQRYDEGLSPEDFYCEVKEAIGANDRLTSQFFTEIWGDIFNDIPGMEAVLSKIKPEIKKMMLSNTNPAHWKYISRLMAIRNFFGKNEQLVLSFKVGACKPDKKIFLAGVEQSGYGSEEIVYVDDIQEYVEAFKKFGVQGIVYNCQIDPPEKLQKALAEYGVIKT